MPKSLHPYLAVGLFVMIAAIMYGGLLNQPWSYDDEEHIESAAEALRSLSALWDAQSKESQRLVANTYIFAVYALTSADASTYHLGNILLHLLNCWLLIRVVRCFTDQDTAVVCGFLFLINTAGYEAVYSIAACTALLGTTFALVAVHQSFAYLKGQSRYGWAIAGVCYLACLLSYESYITIFIPLVGLGVALEGFSHRSRRLAISLVGSLVVLALMELLVFHKLDHKISFNELSLGSHVFVHIGFFFGRLILCAFITPGNWSDITPYDVGYEDWNAFAWIGWVLLVVCVVLSVRSVPIRIATVWMSTTTLSYVISSGHPYFTRYWYLAAAGSSLLYAVILFKAAGNLSSALRMPVVVALLVVTSYFAIHKARIFEGRYLFHAANYHLMHKEDYERAEVYYTRVLEDYGQRTGLVYSQLGAAQDKAGKSDRAIDSFRAATTAAPGFGDAHYNLGVSLYRRGEIDLALQSFSKASDLDGTHAESLPAIGLELIRKQEWAQAAGIWQIVCERIPHVTTHHSYLGVSLFKSGKLAQARDAFEHAIRLSEDNTVAIFNLAVVYQLEGNLEEASRLYREGLALEPDAYYQRQLDVIEAQLSAGR